MLALIACATRAGDSAAANYSCSWNTASGDWLTPLEWLSCNSAAPNNGGGSTYDATIAASGSAYTVTLTGAVTIGSLTLNASNATLNLDSNTLTATKGVTLQSGTISGGTIAGTGGTGGTTAVALSGSGYRGTLSGVALNGSLDITGNSATTSFSNLTVHDTSGTGPGVINVTGPNAALILSGSTPQTLDNATVHLGGASGNATLSAGSSTLTLGSGLQVLADGTGTGYAFLSGNAIVNNGTIAFSNGAHNNQINATAFTNNGSVAVTNGSWGYITSATSTNNGTITVGTGSTFYEYGSSVTNAASGTITGANGSTVKLYAGGSGSSPTFVNAGTVTMNGTGGTTVLALGTGSAATSPQWTNTGTINVTDTDLQLNGYFTQSDLSTIHRSGGTVELGGYFDLQSGTLDTATPADSLLAGMTVSNGTIHGGTLAADVAGTLFTAANARGTLDTMTVDGPLNVTGTNADASFSNLTVHDTSGTGPGVINVTGPNAALILSSSTPQTLDNAIVHLGGASGNATLSAGSSTLTLGGGLQVLADGTGTGYAFLSGSAIVNNGSIAFSNGTHNDQINSTTFTNNGTVSVSNGSWLDISSTSTNDGSITVGSGSELYASGTSVTNAAGGTITGADGSAVHLYGSSTTTPGFTNAGTVTMNGVSGTTVLAIGNGSSGISSEWSNTGTINVTNTDLQLNGRFTQADLGTISRSGGTVELGGYFDLQGGTLDTTTPADAALAGITMSNGTVHNGTVASSAAASLYSTQSARGTLDAVTVDGSLDITGNSAQATFSNGLTVTGASGTGPGVINVTGQGDTELVALGTQTLDNVTVHLGGTNPANATFFSSGTLTLGSGVQVLADGSSSSDGFLSGTAIVNDGAIAFSNGAHNDQINPTTFTNNGTVSISNGSQAAITSTTFTNFSSGTLTGGSYQAYAGSTLTLPQNANVTTLAADVVLSGAGSVIQAYDSTTHSNEPIENSLTTVSSAGALHVLAGRNYTTTNAIANQGTIELGGGTFNSASLTNSGTVKGFGTVTPQIANVGVVEATGGTLTATNGIVGSTGTLQIDSTGGLTLGGASTAGTLVHNGTAAGSLNLGSNNIVVSTDYNNASFGTGNAFNNHANVAGTGQIRAAGGLASTAQTISGDIVGGGTTSGDAVINFGVVHVGNSASANFTIGNQNVGGPDLRGAIQTNVNGASITDPRLSGSGVTAQNYGPVAGGSSTGPYTITFNASTGGRLTGQAIHVVNNFDNTNSQTIDIEASTYNYANGSASPSPVTIANQRVGGTGSQTLTVSNTAPNDGYSEVLNASFGANTGNARNNAGAITGGLGRGGLAAGTSDNAAMSVGVDTSSAGAKTGTVTLNYVSNGTGTSGLGNTNVGSQTLNVTGNVYQVAQPSLPATVSLGNFHAGSPVSQAVTIANTLAAPAGFQEGLDASAGTTAGAATISGGPITNLAAGSSSNALSVGLTGTAGVNTGAVTVNLQSNGTGTSGLGTLALASQTIQVTGTGYNLASGSTSSSPITIANQRVGGSGTQGLTVSNTGPVGAYTEVLNAGFGANTGAAGNNGGVISGGLGAGGVAAGTSNGSAMSVGVDTSSAGAKTGTVTVNYVSNGAGTSGLDNTTLASQTLNVSGNVYQVAVAQLNSTPLNFGTVQVGQSVNQVLSVSNLASGPAGFTEDLNARFGATSGTGASLIQGTGAVTGLVAGGTNNSAMTVTVNTSAAGTVNGAIGVDFFTAGTVNGVSNGLGEASLRSVNYGVSGTIQAQAQVINQASPVINNPAIDLGNVRVGATSPTALVSLTNRATTAPQAALDASISGAGSVIASGSVNLLNPGATDATSLQVRMNTASAGHVSGAATVALVSDASNVGGCAPNCQLTLASQNVTVTGNVYQVAQASLPATVNVGNYHVGTTTSQAVTIGNTLVAAGYQEGLNASAAGATGAATFSGGPITNLAAGNTSNAINVGLNGQNAGASTGTVTVDLASNGAGTSGLGTLSQGSRTIQVSGTGYNLATGSVTPAPVTIANQRVGGTNTQALTVSNSAPSGAYTEALNASFGSNSGNAMNNGGAISGGLGAGGIAGGGSNGTAMSVGVDTSSAGAKTGTVTVSYASNGAGTSGLGNTAVGSQVVNVTGNVYQAAVGRLNSAPLNFGTVQVGQTVSQALSIGNGAVGSAGYVEDLNARFGTASGTGAGLIAGTGSISGLVAGGTDTSHMVVSVNTSAAGTVNGAIGVNFFTAGTVNGVSNGLGEAAVGSSNYGVNGTIQAQVINQASPLINNPSIALGNVRVGATSPTALVSLTNQATTAPQAALDASISGAGSVTGSGAINLLAPGATDATRLQVGMNTASAGHVSGTATVAPISDAANVGGCAPNCQMTLASQDVTVTGNVYRTAAPTLNTTSVTLAGRVGDNVSQAVSITNSAAADGYSEGLKASLAVGPPGFITSGALANLAAGGTDAHAMTVGLNTGTAGSFGGAVAVNLASTGAGTSGLSDLALGTANVTVSGKVYTPAVEQVNTTSVDFGIVHVGDSLGTRNVSITNAAAVTALNDVLRGGLGGASGPFTAGGTLGAGLAAGATDATSLAVGLDTATAGVFTGQAQFSGVSHDPDLADAALANVGVNLSGTVNHYANAAFALQSTGLDWSQSGGRFILNFGDLIQGQAADADLSVLNDVAGPSDLLSGAFELSGPLNDLTLSGFGSFAGLAAGQSDNGLTVAVNTGSLGSFDDLITLDGLGSNASGYSGALTDITLELEGDVLSAGGTPVPEPGTLPLLLLGGGILLGVSTRHRRLRRLRIAA